MQESLAQETALYRNLISYSISNGLHPLKSVHYNEYTSDGLQLSGHFGFRTEVRSLWLMGKLVYSREKFYARDSKTDFQSLTLGIVDAGVFIGFFLNRESKFRPSIYFGGYSGFLVEGKDQTFPVGMSFGYESRQTYFRSTMAIAGGIDFEYPLQKNLGLHSALEFGYFLLEDNVYAESDEFQNRINLQLGIHYIF